MSASRLHRLSLCAGMACLLVAGTAGAQSLDVGGHGAGGHGAGPVASLAGTAGDWRFLETGIGSWYGPAFHGRPTASGEIYDQNAMTAAHPWLPFGTRIRVTNRGTGRSVELRVNDRGPNVPGRAVDVSYRAGQQLGMIGEGTTPVDIEVLGPVPPRGASAPPPAAAATPAGMTPCGPAYAGPAHPAPAAAYSPPASPYQDRAAHLPDELPPAYGGAAAGYPQPVQAPATRERPLYIQIGAFEQAENAAIVDANLRHLAPTRIEPVDYDGRRLHRVRLGPFASQTEATDVLTAVDGAGFHGARLVRD